LTILVIGGTQFFGREIVRLFLEHGDNVTVYSRGRRKPEWAQPVEHVQGDRTDHAGFVAAFRPRSFDVVIDNIAYTAADVEAAVAAFAGRVGRYVLTSTGSVYAGPRLDAARLLAPLQEDDADLAVRADEPYGDGKRACEQVLHTRGGRDRGLPFTILRPPVVQGAHDPTNRVWFYVRRIADGGPILAPTGFPSPATRHVYSVDLARAYVDAVTHPIAIDRTYNVAMEEIVTLPDYLRLLGQAMNRQVDVVELPRDALAADESLSAYRPPFSRRFVMDIASVRRDLGWRSTPVSEWLRATAAWEAAHPRPDPEGYATRDAERRVAARLTVSSARPL
jgi:nucleoside-diphosphate-sugar epimerase